MGKGGSTTIGYKYFMALLMGMGRSVSEIVQIDVGGKTAWRGPLARPQTNSYISARDLFGGDEKEGGIDGPLRVLWGDRDQVLPGDIKETISPGQPMPALRGVTCLWYDGEICSINPYPKEWKVRLRRHTHGWHNNEPWYPQNDAIDLGAYTLVTYRQAVERGILEEFIAAGGSFIKSVNMVTDAAIRAKNGAHIIYECVTNPEWGRGIDPSQIDENSFVYAANQLWDERFGLCFFWQRQEDVDAFIQIVLDHIAGELYTDRSTGLLTLRLIRADYDPDDLPTFEPGRGLLEILADDSGSQDIAYNEVVIKYRDPITNTDGEARAHNAGARMSQGSTNTLTKEMPGLPTKDLAARVAVRELIVQSAGLKKYKVRLDRSGWRIAPGMPFRIKCPQRGIASIILRAGEVTDSSSQQGGDIQITALEDVFSMPETGMVQPEAPTWTPPVSDAVPPDESVAFEMSYYDVTKRLNQLLVQNLSDEDAYFGMVASQPTETQLEYDLMIDQGGSWKVAASSAFTGNAKLAEAIGPLDTVLSLVDVEHWPEDVIGDSFMVGDERMRIDAYDAETGTVTVARGVIDTIPAAHAAGAYAWLPDDDLGTDGVVYSPGEEIVAAAATRSASGVLLEEDYQPRTVEIVGRVGRPYPPANLEIDGTSVYEMTSTAHPEPVLTWEPRNRITQADQLVGYFEGPVAAEPGTTYRVDVLAVDGTLLSSHDVADALTFTYGAVEQAADGNPDAVRFNVKAVRSEQASLADYDILVRLVTGWGFAWGESWGGGPDGGATGPMNAWRVKFDGPAAMRTVEFFHDPDGELTQPSGVYGSDARWTYGEYYVQPLLSANCAGDAGQVAPLRAQIDPYVIASSQGGGSVKADVALFYGVYSADPDILGALPGWASADDDAGSWVGYALPMAVTPPDTVILRAPPGGLTDVPGFALQYTDADGVWQTLAEFSTPGAWAAKEGRIFHV